MMGVPARCGQWLKYSQLRSALDCTACEDRETQHGENFNSAHAPVFQYHRNRADVSAEAIGYLTVCSHQHFSFSDLARLEALRAIEPTPPLDPNLAFSSAMLAGFETLTSRSRWRGSNTSSPST